MEILNVGAGQTNQEHAAAEQQRRADLVAESRSAANFFFVAAGLAALGAGLFPIRLNVLVSVGAVDLLTLYGRELGRLQPLAIFALASMWLLVLLVLALAARAGYRWAFWVGIVLYAADMLVLLLLFSLWAFGVHAFFVFKRYQGQQALGEAQPGVVGLRSEV